MKTIGKSECGIIGSTDGKKENLLLKDITAEKASGIYKIVNKINGKYYVGSTNYFWNRWRQHKWILRRDAHKNQHLQSAWNKYGKDAFEFIVAEVVPKEKLVEIEQKYLDIAKAELNKCYNQNFLADRIEFTDEVKKKMSACKMGIPLSNEHKSSISQTNKKVMAEMRERFMDKTIYAFHNELTSEDFIGRQSDLYSKYKDVTAKGINRVVRGERNHHKHWTIKGLSKVYRGA